MRQNEEIKFTVETIDGTNTRHRKKPHGEFLVVLDNNSKLKDSAGEFILLSNTIDGELFKIQAKLCLDKLDDKCTDQKLGIVKMDQKLRQAIGVVKDDTDSEGVSKNDRNKTEFTISTIEEPNTSNLIKIYIRKIFGVLKGRIRKIFGVQVNLARVMIAHHNDMEINVCRINIQVMKSIGIEEGDIVNIESASGKTVAIRALDLTEHIENYTLQEIDNNIAEEKYTKVAVNHFFPGKAKNRKADSKYALSILLIDYDARDALDVKPCDPVRVYRSIRHIIMKKMHLISWPLILLAVGLGNILKERISPVYLVAAYVISFIILILINMVEIRQKVNIKQKQPYV